MLEAFSDDLDTPRALQVVRAFEKSDASAGSKLETFLWADRLLGLDLARDIGKAPAALPAGAQELLDASASRRAPARTSPAPTGCGTSWPRWASP